MFSECSQNEVRAKSIFFDNVSLKKKAFFSLLQNDSQKYISKWSY